MRYARIINDIHIGGPLEMFKINDLIHHMLTSPYPIILAGDIIDLKNCKKEHVGYYKDMILEIKGICRKNEFTYLGGNHEMKYGNLPLNYVNANAFFSHSHMLADPEKWGKWDYATMGCGAGWIKRNLFSPLIDDVRHLLTVRPSQILRENLNKITLANKDITRIFLAHSHPDEDVNFFSNQALCTILPRGINDITY